MIRALLLTLFVSYMRCEDTLELLLSSYENPGHKLYDGLCCDSPSFTMCQLDPCDNTITLCLLPHTVKPPVNAVETYLKESGYRNLVCPDGWININLGLISRNSDNVTFPGEGSWINEHRKLRNPIALAGKQWKDGFKLLVLVADFDLKRNELINVLAADWEPLVQSEEFSPSHQVKSLTKGDTHLNLKVRLKRKQDKPPSRGKSEKDGTPPSEPDSENSKPPTVSSVYSEAPTTPVTATTESDTQYTSTQVMHELTTRIAQELTSQTVQDLTTAQQSTTKDTTDSNQDEDTSTPGVTTQGATTREVTTLGFNTSNQRLMVNTGSEVHKTIEKDALSDTGSSTNPIGAIVSGIMGVLVVIIVAVLASIMCVSCLQKKEREDRARITGSNNSEVTALRSGPIDNPTYTSVGISPNNDKNTQTSYGFNNSLYGALSQGGMSGDSHMTSPPNQSPDHGTSPAYQQSMDSQYSQISRQHMNSQAQEDSGSYSEAIEHVQRVPLTDGYSVISREHMENDGYSVVTRENLLDDPGYSFVTREHLDEASDSEPELDQQPTSRLLSSQQKQ